MMRDFDNWINGEARPGESGERLLSRNPATGEEVASYPRSTAADVDLAVAAATAAAGAWRGRRPIERGRVLLDITAAIRDNATELARLEASESGKLWAQATREIDRTADYFEYFGGLVNSSIGETLSLGPDFHAFTQREPFGVIGIITPWNAPMNQAARAAAPALATGNAVVIKPSEYTSATTIELGRISTEVGLPDGVLNVVTGEGGAAGRALVSHAGVRKVAFTGSVRAGREIGRIAADRVIPVTLELGGKSANIVFADADIDKAIGSAFNAFTANAGQICSAGTRLLLQREIHDSFVSSLADMARAARYGATLGALTTPAQFEKVQSYFRIAKDEGAVAVTGGSDALPDSLVEEGYYVPATIYVNVDNSMRIAQEEVFGPVLSVMEFGTEDEAVELANGTPYGLVSGVWTSDISRALRVAGRLESGQVFINSWLTGAIEIPFGGYKLSGYGREKGLEALREYTQVKCIAVAL